MEEKICKERGGKSVEKSMNEGGEKKELWLTDWLFRGTPAKKGENDPSSCL